MQVLKIYTIINIIGLALSILACVIIIFRYVEQGLTVNSDISSDRDRIAFQIQEDKSSPGSRFGTELDSDPDIECSSTILWYNKDVIILDKERLASCRNYCC